MTTPPSTTWPVFAGEVGSARRRLLVAVALVLCTLGAYATSFYGALVFDDLPGIANNPTIRDLRRLDQLLVAIGPRGGTLSGRPVPNFTLALNYAISGPALWSYHAVNLLIHLLAGLTLFGLVRRTLLRPPLGPRYGAEALSLAFLISLLWSLHPLQTEAVTYLVQRVESLMGLCYLLTLYCFLRAIESPAQQGRWYLASFCACLTGMGCKEVMVTAPLVVWLFDRTFVSGSWRAGWKNRRGFYAALFSTWILLAVLVRASGGRGGTGGFAAGLDGWHYALTQCKVILAYLQLSLWPHPLIFDRNVKLVSGLAEVWPQALAVGGILSASIYLLVRRPMAGFLGAWFFLILAPTSSFMPIADAMVEHRMYLPLAAVLVALVVGFHRGPSRWRNAAWTILALALGITTAVRNLDYRSPRTLWEDTVRKAPGSARAHNSLGAYLLEENRLDEARTAFATALRLDPRYASAHYNFGHLWEKTGRLAEAAAAYEAAIRLDAKLLDARVNLARVLDRAGDPAAAVAQYEIALQSDPEAGDVHANLGTILLKLKRVTSAIEHLRIAAELGPERAETWSTLARAYQQNNDLAAARRAVEQALQLKPEFPEALYVLGNLEAAAGNFRAAVSRYQLATELAPDYLAARNNLANALLVSGQIEAAITQYRRILQQRPDDRAVQENLARALEAQPAR